MNDKVFHIDQECFVVFVDDEDDTKDRFLRIGNSESLLNVDTKIKLVSLISTAFPGDPEKEEGLLKDHYQKMIGVKDNVNNLIDYLRNKGVSTGDIQKVYADDTWSENSSAKRQTEEDFIKEIEKNAELSEHSFASFYENGNIRIFNKNEVIFDLNSSLKEDKNVHDEIIQASAFFSRFYEDSYKKDGFITAGGSFFLFSQGAFGCITNSLEWYKDAIRAGINPMALNFLYLNTDIKFDQIWFKIFSAGKGPDTRTKIIFKGFMPTWINLLDKKHAAPIDLKEVNVKLNNILFSCGNNNFEISCNKFNLKMSGTIGKGLLLNGQYPGSNFKISLDELQKDALTAYSYNPVIFGNMGLTHGDYINTFWTPLRMKVKDEIFRQVRSSDSDYSNTYVPAFKETSFYSQLFAETVRRITIEGRSDAGEEIFSGYCKLIRDLNGYEINLNSLLIEQELGLNEKTGTVQIRDTMKTMEFAGIDNSANPFMIFSCETDNREIEEMQAIYRQKYLKNLTNSSIQRLIDDRYSEVFKKRKFYRDELERLKKFIEKSVIDDKRQENLVNIKNEKVEIEQTDKTIINDDSADKQTDKTIVNDATQKNNKVKDDLTGIKENQIDKTGNNVIGNSEGLKPKWSVIKKIIAALLSILIILLLVFGGYLLYKKYFKPITIADNNNSNNSQSSVTQSIKNNYQDQTDANGKKSYYYKFSMTIMDLINLTNAIAVKNGYHKMLTEEERKLTVKGNDPDWIYPENILILPDNNKITIKDKDTMWGISEEFLIKQLDIHEKRIRTLIEKTKLGEVTIDNAKNEFLAIKDESFSIMLKDTVDALIKLQNFNEWEPYLEMKKIKVMVNEGS